MELKKIDNKEINYPSLKKYGVIVIGAAGALLSCTSNRMPPPAPAPIIKMGKVAPVRHPKGQKDIDDDGIPDEFDQCPNIPAPKGVQTKKQGCPNQEKI